MEQLTPLPSLDAAIASINSDGSDSYGIKLLASNGDSLFFYAIADGGSLPMRMEVLVNELIIGSVTFCDRYLEQKFAYFHATTGVLYRGLSNSFANSSVRLT